MFVHKKSKNKGSQNTTQNHIYSVTVFKRYNHVIVVRKKDCCDTMK